MTGADDGQEVRDFTLPARTKRFRVDDDVFEAPPILPPVTLIKVTTLHTTLSDATSDIENRLRKIAEMFRLLLPGQSGQRFAERLMSDTEPIDITRQALPILHWLLECYGMRPTEPSSASLNGSSTGGIPNGGTSSTAGASPEPSDISS